MNGRHWALLSCWMLLIAGAAGSLTAPPHWSVLASQSLHNIRAGACYRTTVHNCPEPVTSCEEWATCIVPERHCYDYQVFWEEVQDEYNWFTCDEALVGDYFCMEPTTKHCFIRYQCLHDCFVIEGNLVCLVDMGTGQPQHSVESEFSYSYGCGMSA